MVDTQRERRLLARDVQIQLALFEKYMPFVQAYNSSSFNARWKYVKDYELSITTEALYQTQVWLDK